MKLTVLFDLDDTLLGNEMQSFSSAYFQLLGEHLKPYVPPQIMLKELLAGTRKMIIKRMPASTLEQEFSQAFYPSLGIQQADLAEPLRDFYENVFPQLQPLTTQRPEAIQLVHEVLNRGWQVVIATNPLFPRRAIEHRLEWAGLPVETTPLTLITSFEGMHFAKPSEAYYAEILAQLGYPECPAVMIGNSLEDDILPAARLGLPGFWLSGNSPLPAGLPPLSRTGSLNEVLPWLEQIAAHGRPLAIQGLPAVLGVLGSTPAAIDTLLKQIDAPKLQVRPAAEEWAICEVLCHMRDVDREVNIPRFQKIMTEEAPFFSGIDADAWAAQRNYICESGDSAFQSMMAARTELLSLIQPTAETIWTKPARHAIFGPTTLGEMASFIARHDVLHIQQVVATIAATRTS